MKKTLIIAAALCALGTTNADALYSSRTNASGATHSCVIYGSGSGTTLHCTGSNQYGELGFNSFGASYFTPQLSRTAANITQVATGLQSTCVIQAGNVKCVGRNDKGQLGNNTTTNSTSWVDVSGMQTGDVLQISAGELYYCGIRAVSGSTGNIWCWGQNSSGQIGDGTTTERHVATRMGLELSGYFDLVTTGLRHTCGRYWPTGTTWKPLCWGLNTKGELGVGDTGVHIQATDLATTVDNKNLANSNVGDITAGAEHTCLWSNVSGTPTIYCAGRNDDAQVTANGTPDGSSYSKMRSTGITDTFSFVFAQGAEANHVCVYHQSTTQRKIRCWGRNSQTDQGGTTTTGQVGQNVTSTPRANAIINQFCDTYAPFACHDAMIEKDAQYAITAMSVGLDFTLIEDDYHTHDATPLAPVWIGTGDATSGALGVGTVPPNSYNKCKLTQY